VRWHDYTGAGKPITASVTQTISWSGTEVPGSVPGASVVAFHLGIQGRTGGAADTTIADIQRIRVRANGVTIYDIGPVTTNLLALRSFLEMFNWANTAPGAAGYQLTLPFWIPDAMDEDAMDVCAFPLGAIPTVEVTLLSLTGTGQNLFLGWTHSDIPPAFSPVLYGSQMNIAASVTNGKYPVNEPGFIRALGINIHGLNRFRAVFSGFQRVNVQSRTVPIATSANFGSLLTETGAFRSPLTNAISGGGDGNDDGYFWHKLVGMPSGTPGNSFVELDTNANWGGPTNELTIYALRPLAA